MKQYLQIKAAYPEHVLLFRLGDFYEMFFEDAVKASQALDIVLTKRGRYKNSEVPLAGIPHHALDTYIERFLKRNMTVAICEQLETPDQAKQRKSTVLRRAVTRVVTPGTLIEERFLDPRAHQFLAAVVAGAHGQVGVAWLDISTGLLRLAPSTAASIVSDLGRIQAKEVVLDRTCAPALAEALRASKQLLVSQIERAGPAHHAMAGAAPSATDDLEALVRADAAREHELAQSLLRRAFAGTATDDFSPLELDAVGLLFQYVARTQQGRMPQVQQPQRFLWSSTLKMDASTRRSLELMQSTAGDRRGSLLAILDTAATPAGARLLRSRLQAPTTVVATINERLDQVAFFHEHPHIAADVQARLKKCADVERSLQRLALGRGGPRDLVAIADTMVEAASLRSMLRPTDGVSDAQLAPLRTVLDGMADFAALAETIRAALVPSPAVSTVDGGFVRPGHSAELDRLRSLQEHGEKHVVGLQTKYRTDTGVSSLKIRENRMLGYFIDVPTRAADVFNANPAFRRTQALMDRQRFVTDELMQLERDISQASSKAIVLELEVYDQLCGQLFLRTNDVMAMARALAELDVASAMAQLARTRNYCRPTLVHGDAFHVVGGRHPVVEAFQAEKAQHFVQNDCHLGGREPRIWVITGPNMGGKSTFLRQNALIAVMAQIGVYVPATSVTLGVVDQLFSRVGASDDLVNDRSTFMVEMQETAAILNNATPASLVIMDEVGRGTATHDGTAIAWAALAHLHNVNRARTLFATHYHEVAERSEALPAAACQQTRIHFGEQDGFTYTYLVTPGRADKSYGIQVARMAGLPADVVAMAQQTLHELEATSARARTAAIAPVQPAPAAAASSPVEHPAIQRLRALRVDAVTPRAALDLLYDLKETVT